MVMKVELTKTEKEYLAQLLRREYKVFKKDKKIFSCEGGIVLFHAEEEYEKFLKNLLKKVK